MNDSLVTLTQPEHLHILLNHLPLTGLAAAVAATVMALVCRNRGAMVIGLVLIVLLAAVAWPVMETGESAYNRVRPLTDADGKRALRQHMDLAEDWVKLYYATAAVALLALAVAWMKPRWLWPPAILAVLLAVASLVVGALIAEAGGRIRHSEFRAVQDQTGTNATTGENPPDDSPQREMPLSR
jgi:hypothetical protein